MNEQPQTMSPMERYRQHLVAGELAYQFSPAADRAIFYPRLLCPFTGSEVLEWRISGGRGTIYSLTLVPRRDGPAGCVVLVDLDEGFRMMSRIDGTPADRVTIGARVVIRIARDHPDWDQPYPTFLLAEAVDAA